MHLRFSFNSNNLNAQVKSKCIIQNTGIMHRGLPVVVSIKLVGFDSSESEFGTSVNSTMLAWVSEMSPSGSWTSSYVPSANDVVSICNAIIGN